MNKQEYCELQKTYKKEMDSLFHKLKELDENFIKEHKPFNIGEKVKVRGLGYNGNEIMFDKEVYVSSFTVCDGIIFPHFNEPKKDGAMSKNRFHAAKLCEHLLYLKDGEYIDYMAKN